MKPVRGLLRQEPSLCDRRQKLGAAAVNLGSQRIENGNEIRKTQKRNKLGLLCFKQSAGAYLFILCFIRCNWVRERVCVCVRVIVVVTRSVTTPSATEMARLEPRRVQDWHFYSLSGCSDGELAR